VNYSQWFVGFNNAFLKFSSGTAVIVNWFVVLTNSIKSVLEAMECAQSAGKLMVDCC
jgi:hypothetical protein